VNYISYCSIGGKFDRLASTISERFFYIKKEIEDEP
jgi:hypothetical protein